ncbi:hypothetical protein LTSEURB_6684, partial [Salmonella enterica subsp. enterica serovar Urbana str. R8-2977]
SLIQARAAGCPASTTSDTSSCGPGHGLCGSFQRSE